MFISQRYGDTLDEIDKVVSYLASLGLNRDDRDNAYTKYLALRRKLRDQLTCANR